MKIWGFGPIKLIKLKVFWPNQGIVEILCGDLQFYEFYWRKDRALADLQVSRDVRFAQSSCHSTAVVQVDEGDPNSPSTVKKITYSKNQNTARENFYIKLCM